MSPASAGTVFTTESPGKPGLRKRLVWKAMSDAGGQLSGWGSWLLELEDEEALVLRTEAQIEQDWLFWGTSTFMFFLPPTRPSVKCFFSNRKCPCLTKSWLQEAYRRNAMFYRTPCHSRNKATANKGQSSFRSCTDHQRPFSMEGKAEMSTRGTSGIVLKGRHSHRLWFMDNSVRAHPSHLCLHLLHLPTLPTLRLSFFCWDPSASWSWSQSQV